MCSDNNRNNTKMKPTLVWEKNVTGVGIREVSYKIKETECGSKESGSTCRDQGRYEQAVVAWTDTVVQPFAVMIKVSDALVTRTAMFRIQWSGKYITIDCLPYACQQGGTILTARFLMLVKCYVYSLVLNFYCDSDWLSMDFKNRLWICHHYFNSNVKILLFKINPNKWKK